MATDEGFLQRWSRRKAGQDAPPAEDDGPSRPEAEAAALDNAPPAVAREAESEPTVDPESLPDIESLDANADFSAFMQAGVPDALRTRALQKLWRLDPSFGHIDGLLEYADDFTDGGVAVEAVRTVYKVGKGMLHDEEEEKKGAAVAQSGPDTEVQDATPSAEQLSPPDDRGDAPPETAPDTSAKPRTTARNDDPDRTG